MTCRECVYDRRTCEGDYLICSSAKGVRKELISRGHDAALIKENRDSIDAKARFGVYKSQSTS